MVRYLFALLLLAFSIYAGATLSDLDKSHIFAKNLLENPGFENGKQRWTASAGTFNITITGAYLMDGKVSATWDAAASADTLSHGQITIPNGLLGRNGVLAAKIMVPSGTATHSLQVTDGTNILGTVTITSSTTPTYSYVNFIYPSSGYVVPRLYANANEPNIVVDSVFLGDAETVNLTGISQASFIGAGYFATTASCAGWSRTNTALGAFATDTDCPGPTVEFNPGPGTIQTTDADLPKFTVNNLPSGNYEVWVTVPTLKDGTGNPCTFTLNDGTTSSGRGNCGSTASAADGVTFAGHFNYTTAGNRTFEVYGASGSGAIAIDNSIANKSLQFWIYRYPLASEQAYKPSTVPFLWEGYHDSTCSWTLAATTISSVQGDSSCGFIERINQNAGSVTTTFFAGSASVTPGIIYQPAKVGVYEICAAAKISGTAQIRGEHLQDGTLATTYDEDLQTAGAGNFISTHHPCAVVNYTSMSSGSVTILSRYSASAGTITITSAGTGSPTGVLSGVRWTIKNLSQAIPAPLLVNSVVSPSSGVLKVMSAAISNTGTPTVTRQDGDWISSLTDGGTGIVTINIKSGTCSTVPNCVAVSGPNSDAASSIQTYDFGSTRTTTSIRVRTLGSAFALTDFPFDIICTCQQ